MWQSLGVAVIFFCQPYLKLEGKLAMVFFSWIAGVVGLVLARSLKKPSRLINVVEMVAEKTV